MDIKGDVKKEVYKEIIDLKELNKITNTDKKRYELTQVNIHIMKLCKSYHVEYVSIEDLSMSSSDKGLGRNYNRLVNNTWIRNYLVNNLVKILKVNDIKSVIVPPHYSSFIGQIDYEDDYDSVAASKEIAFRGYLKALEKDIWTYINTYLGSEVTTRWKKMLPSSSTYRDLYNLFKEKKTVNSYRFLFNDNEKQRWSFFRLKSSKSMIDLVTF
ncbi:MAG: hypothetical protein KDH96_13160 [Candidatus Riesia sp.]|nr:hypothetical protein [Candidatus Riesia sp.]